uniref:F-box domain-containing protein n=1 Tax=Strongyloides venezuelensis TaxID=75913 RepID=A0A0K0EUQ0_STRVS
MEHERNTSTFILQLLPSEILKFVLNKVDWKTIYNLRLVSRFYNNFIKHNLYSLPKPKMEELTIKSIYTKYGTKIKFYCTCENKDIKVNFFSPPNRKIIYIKKIEKYLKRIDLTSSSIIVIDIIGQSKVFEMYNRYFKEGSSVYNLTINVERCSEFDDFTSFIQKFKSITYMEMTKLCFSNKTIPLSYRLPIINDMESLSIVECQCTNFINFHMIGDILMSTKKLKFLILSSNSEDLEVVLKKNIRKRHTFLVGKENSSADNVNGNSSKDDEDNEEELNGTISSKTYFIAGEDNESDKNVGRVTDQPCTKWVAAPNFYIAYL